MPFDQEQPHDRHPVLRWIGHTLGIVYILVTLLFGPIKSLARWLAQQRRIQRYEHWVSGFSPATGLAASLLSLSLLELSKIAVLLSYRGFGLLVALVVTLCAKASIGYFAHLTWRAARPQVIAAYPWTARVDAWVEVQLVQLRGFRDRWLSYVRSQPWYLGAVTTMRRLRQSVVRWVRMIKRRLAVQLGR
ncbi:MAG TPA: hypothetical protein P5102_16545 [Candidatus Competibacteraceae bacterium]|nr:hypothetical protein [Candidatus Competibacteraceae bacterium]HRZ07719.1 hypothetical protein [Candidatus Competibacteraceae bacterium]